MNDSETERVEKISKAAEHDLHLSKWSKKITRNIHIQYIMIFAHLSELQYNFDNTPIYILIIISYIILYVKMEEKIIIKARIGNGLGNKFLDLMFLQLWPMGQGGQIQQIL